jgi:phosphopantothenoylcysteine decarboxylase/phosphopantothenate--cysteine ligase
MKGKKIIVGVTGGIAAYKVPGLVRLFVRAGAHVRVAMTASATNFITPLTFETVSCNKVNWSMFGLEPTAMDHIHWGQDADLVVIAPATANFIGKMAHGIADDFLTTMVLAATAKIMLCPSMNTQMFLNPATQDNLGLLRKRGYCIMEPEEGELACDSPGPGRLPEPHAIFEQAELLVTEQDLTGMRILVTAGPTLEPIDPVRYVTNRSSGKMGYALARKARQRGASVILVSGPVHLSPPAGVNLCFVKTAEDMLKTVLEHRDHCDVVIKAAAVVDYRPRRQSEHKIKKREENLPLELVRNPDILGELGRSRGHQRNILVGFAAETEELLANAKDKLEQKNLDMIVANDVSRQDTGFESDTNLVKIIYRGGRVEDFPVMPKDELAGCILDRIRDLWERMP